MPMGRSNRPRAISARRFSGPSKLPGLTGGGGGGGGGSAVRRRRRRLRGARSILAL